MLRIIIAWINFLEKEFRAKAVLIDGKYVVVRILCSDCRFKGSDKTKRCWDGTSQGCDEFIYKDQS